MKANELSVIVIAKNSEGKIGECLESIAWADEIIVIDNGSTDKTVNIARKFTENIYSLPKAGFSELRNEGLKKSTGRWILYIDTDERVTPDLRLEIKSIMGKPLGSAYGSYAIPRKNIIFRKELKHGGLYPDYVKRLFLRDSLKGWKGELHEEPEFTGIMGYLTNPLIHLKHDNLSEMVTKTNNWSAIEAKLLFEAKHPAMTWWRFLRIMSKEVWYRLIVLRGFMDGVEGVIYSLYQMWSRFVTYVKLWEMQQKKS